MSVDLRPIEELERELAIREARDQRNRALAAKGMRRRATRSRIILGGAILAEIRDNPDPDFIARIISILDDRVGRDRDREDLADLMGHLLPPQSALASSSEFPASAELPDFDAMAEATLPPLRSIAETDPAFMDVKHLINNSD
ncbi:MULTISPECIES: hypothetical protein [Sphingomonadaceae]|uniref:Mobilization protein n=1 Tax=Sphingobium baderi TaxID=1332080 RepID=A0A0S3F6J5_9SPHN|nr:MULTISPECIES: hypothetical protein [Sphingomonadaceae]ALR23133.1 hypothetical protein ATN00_21760 [Sphingobium baderi]CDO34643.1 conserved hypothetical protein [Novosphingobium sp. KN65.2]